MICLEDYENQSFYLFCLFFYINDFSFQFYKDFFFLFLGYKMISSKMSEKNAKILEIFLYLDGDREACH